MSFSSWTLNLLLLATAPGQAEPHAINRRDFKIPIVIPAELRAQMKELILFVSADQGKTWQQTGNATPDMDHFRFFAQGDGLYWFSVVVVDQQGNRQPKDVSSAPPSQKILVDSVKPAVQIVLVDRDADEVFVNWDIRDDSLDVNSMRLEYRAFDAPANGLWQTVPVQGMATGRASFRPNYTGPLVVRIDVKDRAGNSGSAQKDVPPASMPSATATPLPPAPNTPTTASPMISGNNMPVANGQFQRGAYPPSVQPNSMNNQPNSMNNQPNPMNNQPNSMNNQPNPMNNQQNSPFWGQAQQVPNSNFPPSNPPYPPNNQAYPPNNQAYPPNNQAYPPNNQAYPNYNTASPVMPPGGAEQDDRPLASSGGMPAVNPVQPQGNASMLQPPRIVNSPQVALEYEVKCGTSGVSKVELWLSSDDGRTWRVYSNDPTVGSPLEATLPGEGIFGLKLVVHSGAGLTKGPPQPGDPPDLRLEVDTTPPLVQLYPPKPDLNRRDTLSITWNAADRNLAPRPVTLEWAERPEGPWRLIATDLPSNGAHAWQLTAEIPYRVHLRATGVDIAGNRGIAETQNHVLTDLNKPEGRILGIVPVSRTGLERP